MKGVKVTQGQLMILEEDHLWSDGYLKKTLVVSTQTKYGYGDIRVVVVKTGKHKTVKVEQLKPATAD